MIQITFPVAETILLTGAGFTHNFGGFLARTMWAEVHNRAQRYNIPRIINLLKDNYNYEDVYDGGLNDPSFTDQEKDALLNAVYDAYETLDGVLRYYNSRDITTALIDISELSNFILRFAGQNKNRGFFFTLNQDIFIERYFVGTGMDKPLCPGITIRNNLRFSTFDKRGNELTDDDYGIVPTMEQIEIQMKGLYNFCRLYYVKLHGSYDWRDSCNRKKLVIGTSKIRDIQSEPIFNWNFQIFKTILSMADRRLLIIGYGFRDQHINDILLTSVRNSGLKIYIICPMDPEEFYKGTLANFGECRESIWRAIVGYYPYTLAEIFPRELPESQHLGNLKKDLFGN